MASSSKEPKLTNLTTVGDFQLQCQSETAVTRLHLLSLPSEIRLTVWDMLVHDICLRAPPYRRHKVHTGFLERRWIIDPDDGQVLEISHKRYGTPAERNRVGFLRTCRQIREEGARQLAGRIVYDIRFCDRNRLSDQEWFYESELDHLGSLYSNRSARLDMIRHLKLRVDCKFSGDYQDTSLSTFMRAMNNGSQLLSLRMWINLQLIGNLRPFRELKLDQYIFAP
jgi:hypothetical protein